MSCRLPPHFPVPPRYYHLFAGLYGLCGAFVALAMVNSSWTRGHIQALWRFFAPAVHTVFPPCDIASFKVRGH